MKKKEKHARLAPAFFLDRDGTINFDRVYINNPDLIELIPGAAAAVARANEAGFRVVVITNQSGIGRGLIDAKMIPLIHERVSELLRVQANASVDAYEFCPHRPEEGCDCRKPGTALVERAAKRMGLDIERSFFIGDSHVDVECGKNLKCTSILVRTGKGKDTALKYSKNKAWKAKSPDYIAVDLAAAVDWALKR